MANMVDMLDFGVIRSDYDRWFSIEPYAILYINKMQYEVMMSEVDKYKAIAEAEKRRREAAEARFNAGETLIQQIDDDNQDVAHRVTDISNYGAYAEWQQSIADHNAIIKEAGE